MSKMVREEKRYQYLFGIGQLREKKTTSNLLKYFHEGIFPQVQKIEREGRRPFKRYTYKRLTPLPPPSIAVDKKESKPLLLYIKINALWVSLLKMAGCEVFHQNTRRQGQLQRAVNKITVHKFLQHNDFSDKGEARTILKNTRIFKGH